MDKDLIQNYKGLCDQCKETTIFILYMDPSVTTDQVTQKLMSCFSIASLINLSHKSPFHKYLLSLIRELCYMSVDLNDQKKKDITTSLTSICEKLEKIINQNK